MELPEFESESGLRNPDDFARSSDEPEFADALEDHESFERLLNEADRRGILDVPAEDGDAARAGNANLVREGVIAERLWLLGYLKRKSWVASSQRDSHRQAFLEAVARFQTDAGLHVDAWSGDETWQALHQLVTFESATHVDRYCDGDVPKAALVRSLRLRLWALGLLKKKPTISERNDQLPVRGLARFWAMWRGFSTTPLPAEPPPTPELIDLVFEQDKLLANIAGLSGSIRRRSGERLVFRRRRFDDESSTVNEDAATFLVCVAKIELWLLGFDVDISDQSEYPVVNIRDGATRAHDTLRVALVRFWDGLAGDSDDDDAGLSASQRRERRARRRRLRNAITPELFIALQDPGTLGELTVSGKDPTGKAPEEDDLSREVSDIVNTDEQVRATWSQGKGLGMKLWDGMRRLWRWIARGVRALLRIGRNIVRVFFRYSLKAFEIARLSVVTVVESSRRYVSGRIFENPSVHVIVDAGGDMRAMIGPAALPDDVGLAGTAVTRFGHAFLLSCRILAMLLRAVRNVALGIFGWARLLWVLVRCYSDIRPLYKAIQALSLPA